jgi:hypothetical protein
MTEATHPDFRSPCFLPSHILRTMAFDEGRCIDPAGAPSTSSRTAAASTTERRGTC